MEPESGTCQTAPYCNTCLTDILTGCFLTSIRDQQLFNLFQCPDFIIANIIISVSRNDLSVLIRITFTQHVLVVTVTQFKENLQYILVDPIYFSRNK